MPPSEQPIRERIERAMATRLAAISAGSVYWTTPALITRALLAPDQYKAELAIGPVLGVMRSSGNPGSVLELGREASADMDEHHVSVWGYVLGRPDLLAGDVLNRLWQDVTVCLLADSTLGGLVIDLRPEGAMETDGGVLEPQAWFRQHWLATS